MDTLGENATQHGYMGSLWGEYTPLVASGLNGAFFGGSATETAILEWLAKALQISFSLHLPCGTAI